VHRNNNRLQTQALVQPDDGIPAEGRKHLPIDAKIIGFYGQLHTILLLRALGYILPDVTHYPEGSLEIPFIERKI
jgi:hypothetical protein